MITEDLMWYRPDLARDQIEHFFDLWRPSDGQIAFTKRLNVLEDSAEPQIEQDFSISQSPLWIFFLLNYLSFYR